jgi:hypothetical protein
MIKNCNDHEYMQFRISGFGSRRLTSQIKAVSRSVFSAPGGGLARLDFSPSVSVSDKERENKIDSLLYWSYP